MKAAQLVANVLRMLLSFLCFYESVGLGFESWSALRMITDSSTMPRSTCFYRILPYIFTLTVQASMMVMPALDILIALMLPFTYRLIRWDLYALLMHIPCILIAMYFIFSGIIHMNNEVIMVCNPPLALPPSVSAIWNFTTMSTNLAVVFVYLLVFLRLMRQDKVTVLQRRDEQPKHYKKILCSTLTLNAVSVVCWFIGAGVSRLPFNVSPETKELIHTYAVVPPLVIMCQNYYVYFLMSSEYRMVFRKMLGF